MIQRIIAGALLLLTGTPMSFSQEAKISGNVVFLDHSSYKVASVSLKNTFFMSPLDSLGAFEIIRVEFGTYVLQVNHNSEVIHEQIITINNAKVLLPSIQIKSVHQALQGVEILGNKREFDSDYAAKMPLKNNENSQVVSIVSSELLKNQQVNNMEDAMANATGISVVFPATGRATDGGTYYSSRGFTTNASLMNGISGVVYSNPDACNIERVEILKGPSATLFGSSLTSFGGAINTITKQPLKETFGSIQLGTGSWGMQRLAVDYNTPLSKDKKTLFRVNAAYQYQNSFQDYGFTKRIAISPTLTYQVSDKVKLSLETNFSKNQGTLQSWYYADSATTGVLYADELNMDNSKYYFPGDLYSTNTAVNSIAQARIQLNKNWTSQTVFSSSINNSQGPGVFMYVISDSTLQRENQTFEGKTMQWNLQENVVFDGKMGRFRNRFVAGADIYQNTQNSTYAFVAGLTDTVNMQGPNPNYMDYNATKYANASKYYFFGSYTGIQKTTRFGAYVSDVFNVTDHLLVNLGVRGDYFWSDGYSNPQLDTVMDTYKQGGFSPKAGIVYQVWKERISFFGNVQNSFQNVSGRSFDGKLFIPQNAMQFEAGLKWDFFNGRLVGSVSAYTIKVNNSLRQDTEHPLFSVQDGTQESKGMEIEVNGELFKGLQMSVGYGYNNNKYIKSDERYLGRRPVEAGAPHLAHAWLNYSLPSTKLKGLSIGFGGNYSSRKMTNNDAVAGVFYLPEYLIFNTSIGYENNKFGLRASVNNLTNQIYYVGWNQIALQNPREFLVSLSIKF